MFSLLSLLLPSIPAPAIRARPGKTTALQPAQAESLNDLERVKRLVVMVNAKILGIISEYDLIKIEPAPHLIDVLMNTLEGCFVAVFVTCLPLDFHVFSEV